MRNTTDGNGATIAYDDRETREMPRTVSGITWATIALLALIVILGALFISGFFSSLSSGHGYDQSRPSTSSSRGSQTSP